MVAFKEKKEKIKRAVGYIRVSSKEQAVMGESLRTQRKAIDEHIKNNGWECVEIYSDEGISGGTVEKRKALQRLLRDAGERKFEILVIHSLSRFGRNARELLINCEELKKARIELRSIKESIDFSNPYGKAMLTMLSAVAELERESIKERCTENRIARAQRGVPTSGSLPFGRTYDKGTGKWSLDNEKARLIRWAASEYLKGKSLKEISITLTTKHKLPLSYCTLIDVLSKKSGGKWVVNFENQEPIEYKIPHILDDKTIQAIKARLSHNKTHNRLDVHKYALAGFLRCNACEKTLHGHTQWGGKYQYYTHVGGKYELCKAFRSVPLERIEQAVFNTLWEHTFDKEGFQAAIKDSLPDSKLIESLKEQIITDEKEIKRIEKELDKLVAAYTEGTLQKITIKKRESELLEAKSSVETNLEGNREKLNTMPSLADVQKNAEEIRKRLVKRFQSPEHLKAMTHEEKQQLLFRIFPGKDDSGRPYSIYIRKGKGDAYHYDIYAPLFASGFSDEPPYESRTIKGDNLDYRYGDIEQEIRETLNKKKGNKHYKTNIVAQNCAEIIKRAANIQVRHVYVPVFVRL